MPYSYNDELIGILEAGSEQSNALNTITFTNCGVLSLFTIAMKRSQDEERTD